MRTNPTVAALAALTIALPAATPAAAANPLASIFSCQASGGKQEGGAVIGGVVGGLVGNKVAGDNKTVGTVLGAALGAAAGSYIGCKMQKSSQRKAEQAARDALDRNRTTRWTDPATGASGETRLVSTEGGPVALDKLRLASGVDLAGGYDGLSGRYQAPKAANLRAGPSTAAAIVGKLRPGERIDALARVSGTNWLLAGRDGVGVGYISESVVRPVAGAQVAAAGPVCRTFDQTIRTADGGADTQRYRACRGADGAWAVEG